MKICISGLAKSIHPQIMVNMCTSSASELMFIADQFSLDSIHENILVSASGNQVSD